MIEVQGHTTFLERSLQ